MGKKLHTLLLGAMMLQAGAISAQNATPEYAVIGRETVKSISPNGKYAVGINSAWGEEQFSGFVWDTSTKSKTFTTTYNAADLSTSGMLTYVNDKGVVVGASKSEELKVDVPATDYSDAYTMYFANASVWKNGKITRLGIGTHKITEFTDDMDGSYATTISADGNVIAGYIYKSYSPAVPCAWQYDENTKSYTFFDFALPVKDCIGQITSMANDATVLCGSATYGGCRRPVIWTSPENCFEVNLGVAPSESNGGEAVAVSPNGKYVLLYVNQRNNPLVAVFDVDKREPKIINLKMDALMVKALPTIDDNGNFFVQITDKDYNSVTYYYSNASKSLITMAYFMQNYAPDMAYANITNASLPAGMSADGLSIVGNNSSESESWYLKAIPASALIESVQGVKVYATGKDKLSVAWNKVENMPEGVTLKQYDLYVNDDVYGSISAAEAADKSTLKMAVNALSDTQYTMYVKVVGVKDGKDIQSDASDEVEYKTPATYDMPMFDDFEGQSFATNGWTRDLVKGNVSDIIQWNISGGSAYDYENSTYFANFTTISSAPFEGHLMTRFIDATDVQNPYLAFSGNLTYVNFVPSNLDNDMMDIEYTLDGETWTKLYTLNANEMEPYVWNFYKYDLSALSGKVFQLRFNAHGNGDANLRWSIDQVSINNELDNAPEGIKAIQNEDGVNLTWKNSFGSYEVSYLANSNVIPCFNIGNEGKSLITAVEFTDDMLSEYIGQYITSVTSFIYDDPSLQTLKHTKAEAIVYCDGVEVSRQAFNKDAYNNPYSDVVALSTPVKIEAGRTYRIACRISNYDPSQSPLYYQASLDCSPYLTDLYSEDEGKTWNSVAEFNAENEDQDRAYCVWPLRANITETPEAPMSVEIDNALIAYNVFRNGELLNKKPIYAPYLKYLDESYKANDKYSVMAFYNDGRISAISDECTITVSSISNTFVKGEQSVTIDSDAKTILVNGDFDNVSMVSVNGQTVASTSASTISTNGLAKGVYVITVSKNNKKATYKVTIK